jgi:hypothetical protein
MHHDLCKPIAAEKLSSTKQAAEKGHLKRDLWEKRVSQKGLTPTS